MLEFWFAMAVLAELPSSLDGMVPQIQLHPNVVNQASPCHFLAPLYVYCFKIFVIITSILSCPWNSWAQAGVSHINFNSTLTFNTDILNPDYSFSHPKLQFHPNVLKKASEPLYQFLLKMFVIMICTQTCPSNFWAQTKVSPHKNSIPPSFA